MRKVILIAVFAISVQPLFAQKTNETKEINETKETKETKEIQDTKNNFVKLNLFALPLKNISVQYERILNKTIGLNLGVRYMPPSKIPGINYLKEVVKEGVDIQNVEMSNLAITPEVRFYVSKKGYGNGFYIGPYYRFENFNIDKLKYEVKNKIAIGKGSVSSHSLGLILGVQWVLGKKKNIILDWTILGAHYGVIKGNLDAISNVKLTAEEQDELDKLLKGTDIPFLKKTTTVNANGANAKISGPWGGLRSAFSIGIGF